MENCGFVILNLYLIFKGKLTPSELQRDIGGWITKLTEVHCEMVKPSDIVLSCIGTVHIAARGNIAMLQDDIVTYVARCLYVEYGRTLQLDVVKSKMADYFPKSFMTSHANGSKARDAAARAVMTSFEKQGFSGYAVPAKYVSI